MIDTLSNQKKHPMPMRQRSGARIAAVQLNFQHLFVSADLQSSISDFLMQKFLNNMSLMEIFLNSSIEFQKK